MASEEGVTVRCSGELSHHDDVIGFVNKQSVPIPLQAYGQQLFSIFELPLDGHRRDSAAKSHQLFLELSTVRLLSDRTMSVHRRTFAVIGAGPCGIASVGRLVDLRHSVVWIDPLFQVGRMGQHYRHVPANTVNADLVTALDLCQSFQFRRSQDLRRQRGDKPILDLPAAECADLGLLVDALEDITTVLKKNEQVNCIAGTVRAAVADRDGWKLCIDPTSSDMDLTSTDSDSISIHADHVIFVCGARPCIGRDYESSSVSQANPLPPLHSMDSLVDPRRCQTLVREVGKAVVWGVVGGSHSAMLIVKNLLEAGVDRVVNYYKSDLRIMHQTPDGWLRYVGIGLKGPVGTWANSYTSDAVFAHPQVERVRFNPEMTWQQQFSEHEVQQAVFAIGFELDELSLPKFVVDGKSIDRKDLEAYDRDTGEIKAGGKSLTVSARLFGGGIAFPQNYTDGGGGVEPWVGFKRSIEQIDLMVKNIGTR